MAHTLLLVDDEKALLSAMRDYLTMRGFEVDCATEVEEAQALLECGRYSAVVCDVALTGVVDAAGLEVIALLRDCCPSAKIVVLTGIHHPDIDERIRSLRVDRILFKPQPMAVVAATLETLLGSES